MKLTQPPNMDNVIQEFKKYIKKDTDMPGLSLCAQKELRNRIDRKNKYHDRRFTRLLIWKGSIAASICLFLVAGWYFLSSPPQPISVDYAGIMQSFEHVDQITDNVQLILSNNRKISIEGQEAELNYDEGGRVNINQKEKVDANDGVDDEKIVYNQLFVPAGKRSMITFNDGTRVWINAASKLVYPVNFEKNKREIFVEGEIYLDVSHDPKRPFIVRAGTLDVRVLGTQFNISAYRDQPDLQVVLVSGEVEISKNNTSKEILKPNQLFAYNEASHEYSTSMVDVSDYIAWKDGYYPFYSQDFGTVLAKLSKYYAVQFKWNEKLNDLTCSGKLDLKDDLQEVFKVLEKTAPIEIRKTSEREYTVIVKP